MITVIIQHEVKDFAQWKPFFDADEPNRTQAGIKLVGLYTAVQNPNQVTIIFDLPSMELFEGMMNNSEMAETMKKAGVISAPVVSVMHKA